MIPLRDQGPHGRLPLVTVFLIAVNAAVFLYQRFWGPLGFEGYVERMGLVPVELAAWRDVGAPSAVGMPPLAIVTSMFMHGGFFHLISNMWYAWIFADNIEHTLGRWRFLVFYLTCGVVAALAHVVVHPRSTMPLVGASGAIAGVLGGYLVLFPKNRVLTLVPIFFYFTTVAVPAFFFLGLWFLLQVLSARAGGYVAWWAHIGGFVAGVVLVRFLSPARGTLQTDSG